MTSASVPLVFEIDADLTQIWLAASSEHFAFAAFTLTNPTCSRTKVFRLFMLMVSWINRDRSVKCVPSGREKAQEISIPLTAKPLSLRSVMVTKALEPRPPLRQDCDDIFRPSTGEGCKGTIASEVAGSNEDSLARPTVETGFAETATAAAGCIGRLAILSQAWLKSSPPAAVRITTIGNQPTAVRRWLAGMLSARSEWFPQERLTCRAIPVESILRNPSVMVAPPRANGPANALNSCDDKYCAISSPISQFANPGLVPSHATISMGAASACAGGDSHARPSPLKLSQAIEASPFLNPPRRPAWNRRLAIVCWR
jgi:hypothetical protein